MDIAELFDTYGRQARLQPALLALFPLIITFGVWTPVFYNFASGFLGVAVSCGLIGFLAHIAREKGRVAERKLFELWDGPPTTRWLRHRDRNLDETTKNRYHLFLENNVPEWKAPSKEEEESDPSKADGIYESAIRWLREQEFSGERFKLVFKENVSYGFRRNLYGIRGLGICITGFSLIANIAMVVFYKNTGTAELASSSLSFLMLIA